MTARLQAANSDCYHRPHRPMIGVNRDARSRLKDGLCGVRAVEREAATTDLRRRRASCGG